MATALDGLVEVSPGIRGGQPRIAGTRLAVSDIAVMYARLGLTAEEIAGKYSVPLAAVHAALSFYYTHREEIDQRIADDEAFASAFKRGNPGPLREKLRGLLGE